MTSRQRKDANRRKRDDDSDATKEHNQSLSFHPFFVGVISERSLLLNGLLF